MLTGLLAGYPMWVAVAISLTASLAVAYLVGEVAARIGRAIIARFVRDDGAPAFSAPLVRRPIRAIRLSVFFLVALVLVFPALKVAGANVHVGYEPEAVVSWMLASGIRIAVIVLLAAVVIRATATAIRRVEEEIGSGLTLDALERAKRVHTLGTLITNTVSVVAVSLALLMILREIDVDVLPLLTGAGIAGLAIGFGAQTLVKDIISGFFMIVENQVRVGDVAIINGTGGVVESMRLRTVTLRDLEGTVHVFPNGSITTLSNRTKDFSYAVLDMGVAYKEDTDRVCEIMSAVAGEMQQDERFRGSILAPLEILGVDAFEDSAVVIKIRIKTLPIKQWEIARELRRRLKKAFDANGIEIPFPQRTLHLATGVETSDAVVPFARVAGTKPPSAVSEPPSS